MKSKPAPISIPPQTGANLSRLRSPRVWSSKHNSLDSSPPPYTPPPMLSPNRQGSGLFASLSKWSTTPTSTSTGTGSSGSSSSSLRSHNYPGAAATLVNRRYSSYYHYYNNSSNVVSSATSLSSNIHNDLDSSHNNTSGQLKRRHASSSGGGGIHSNNDSSYSSNTSGIGASNQSINIMDPNYNNNNNNSNNSYNSNFINNTDACMRDINRPIAYTRRRRQQLTPKSAPVLILNTCTNKNQTNQSKDQFDDNEDETIINETHQPTFSSTDTIFGYDDETMRRFAEADAVHEAYRLSRQKQRRNNYASRRHNYNSESDLILNNNNNDNINEMNHCEKKKTDQSFNFTDEQLLNFDFEMKTCGETDYPETAIQFNEDVEFGSGDEMDDDDDDEEIDDEDDDDEGVPTSIIPHINIGNAYQAVIPDLCQESATATSGNKDSSEWETLLWYPANLDEDDPKNIESLNLLMKIACSPAVRNCGLNMEYTFHLLCKYKGDLEMTLHALLRDTLVVYDYVYAETTAWTTEEIVRFQQGLAVHGRDFHQVAKDLQAAGMNKTVKACVEFYYVWKRMNTPSDVKWYRDRARRQRPPTRIEPIITEESLSEQFEAIEQQCNAYTDVNTIPAAENNLANVPYNLRRKHNNNNNPATATATQRQQSSLPIEAPPPPPFCLSPPPPLPPASISSNTRSNELNTIQHNDENSLENSYDDFMDIVFNESFPISSE